MTQEEMIQEANHNEGLPSLFKTWNQFYTLVMSELVVLIALFCLFTKIFE